MFFVEIINIVYVVVCFFLLYDCEVKDIEYFVGVCFFVGGWCLYWFGCDEFLNGC